jgi:hypothetical protein
MSRATSMFSKWLIEQSARVLIDDKERYLEQWLADLEDRHTSLAKLLFALGILRAAAVLRRESLPARLSQLKVIPIRWAQEKRGTSRRESLFP